MKLGTGLLVSLLVATACLVACGDSDDGPGVRNAALLTSDTTEVKVSSGDDSKGDSDYNDVAFTFKSVCHWADNGTVSTRVLGWSAVAHGGSVWNELHFRLPPLSKAPVTRLGPHAFIHDTVYIASEGTAQRLCDDPNQALQEESEANRRQILEALESANAKAKGGPENIPLDKLLLPDKETPSDLIWAEESLSGSKSDKDLQDLSVYIELLVLGREGESSNDLNARREAILGELSLPLEPSLLDEGSSQQPININTNLCPSRREAMRSSHPHGPYVLLIELKDVAGWFVPQICLLGIDVDEYTAEGLWAGNRVPHWGSGVMCRHPHGSIYIPEGGRCSDLVPE